MTDRELLKLAAKAAGIEIDERWDFDESWGFRLEIGNGWWNPLTDDGDALRLAVKLNLLTKHSFLNAMAEENDICDGDYFRATRRAIVRAAAEIGKTK